MLLNGLLSLVFGCTCVVLFVVFWSWLWVEVHYLSFVVYCFAMLVVACCPL